jgi:hypothetical protein
MAINLSWDLFIVVFFTLIIAYSFIIGKNRTVKVIIGTYLAILTADGLGNLLERYLVMPNPLFQSMPAIFTERALVLFKIGVFLVAIVIVAVKGGFSVNLKEERTGILKVISNFCFGFLNAGLMISTILIYISGFSFVQGAFDFSASPVFEIYKQSQLVKIMVNNYNFWFSLPAIAFVFISLIGMREPEVEE